MEKLKVINCFAGPGAGKSTTAAGVFSELKLRGVNAELVTEYAKDLTWEQRHWTLRDQIYVFAKQQKRLSQLIGQVEVVVTDSPLLLSMIYDAGKWESLPGLVWEAWDSYQNINFFIERVKPYNPSGRNQTEGEAIEKDREILQMLDRFSLKFLKVPGNAEGIRTVVNHYVRYYSDVNKGHAGEVLL